MGISKFVALLSWGVYSPFSTQLPQYKCLLGATSIEKIPKISSFGRNFLDPSPYFGRKPNLTDDVNWGSPLIEINFDKESMNLRWNMSSILQG